MQYITYECDKCHIKTTDLTQIVRCSIPRFVEIKIDNEFRTVVSTRHTDLCKKCAEDIASNFKTLNEVNIKDE